MSGSPNHYGGCLCGDIRIAVDIEPMMQIVCHCTDCQQESGSAFMLDTVFPFGSVKVAKGTPTLYDVAKPSGNHVRHYFCGRCGSTLWTSLDVMGKIESVKAGTFSAPDGSGTQFFKPTAEIFTASRQHWVAAVEGAKQHKLNPQ